ncbi:MAG TPA: hypothetical protein VHB25_10680 [Gemmatimonadaceae bacterium]|nr:hypothetical protein [Gemmatimonadaceae bacterium]
MLLPRTRLAYIHLRNLLTDAKRDRAARISGYVAISLPDELVTLYLLGGEVVNATVRDREGSRALPIATALEKVPPEPEYGEICFSGADDEQLDAMYATQTLAAEPWPADFVPQEPSALFPYLMSITFDGVLEIIANDCVNYLFFKNGTVARAFLASSHHGTLVDRVAKLFAREGRVGELRVARWGPPEPLPIQAAPALVQAYRELATGLVRRLVEHGRDSAPAIAEHARQNLLAAHPVLDGFSFSDRAPREPLAPTDELTAGVAAWLRDVMWAAADHDSVSPEELLRQLTWDRRHMFQSAGLFEQVPWKVM